MKEGDKLLIHIDGDKIVINIKRCDVSSMNLRLSKKLTDEEINAVIRKAREEIESGHWYNFKL